jgi:outer membrane protein insertion porin family
VPIIPAPGTQSTPQQETPNRIQVPINGDGQPAPGSFPNQPNQPIPPSPPATEQTQPPEEIQPSPPATPAPEQTQPDTTPEAAEPRVLVAEVAVSSETGELPQELQNAVYQAIQTQPGRITTRSQLQEDINAVFATGFFSNVRAIPEDTPLGVRVSFVVQPNPVLRDVQVQANPGTNVPSVLPPKVVNDIFREQYGSILNLRRFQEGVKQLNQWYQKNGYVLAQVVEAPQVAPNGTVTLQVAEGVVEDIQVRFLQEGEANNDEGQPIKGRTRNFIVTRELALKPGNVFNRNVVQQDLQRVYGLGLFEDVNVSLNPGQDPRKVVVVVNVDERQSGSIGLSGGISSASGLFGAVSFQQQNLGGNNQNLGTELQVGEREVLFDVRFTDPWIAGDPYRTSYTVNGFRRRSISLIFDGEDENIEVGDEDDPSRPRVLRLGGGVNFTRPLSRDPLRRSEWTASTGLQYQRVSIRDNDGEISPIGRIGDKEIPLSFSGDGTDDLLTLQLGAARDLRNNLLTPTTGSFLRFGLEQSVPIGDGNILLSRLRGSYSQYIPVNFTNFNEGPETLAFNVQAGTVIGDLPPYEAFSLGGSNSVRGYDEGDLGSGRSFVQATAEYRFPIFAIVGGALFFDVGSDLGTGKNVPGDPAGLLGKPGTGIGYGVGVRVNSPLGPLRLDYGFNEDGDSRLNFGIGEKF